MESDASSPWDLTDPDEEAAVSPATDAVHAGRPAQSRRASRRRGRRAPRLASAAAVRVRARSVVSRAPSSAPAPHRRGRALHAVTRIVQPERDDAPAPAASASAIVVVTAAELAALITRAVCCALDQRERTSSDVPDWLDAKATAAMLGVTPRQAAKLAACKAIPSTRVGKLLRFRRTDVIAYLERSDGA